MSAGDTQPTLPIPDGPTPGGPVSGSWKIAEPEPRRRRVWPWIVAGLIVVALAIAAWFAGEAIARSVVTNVVRNEVITRLALPADQDVQVDVAGLMIPQLISGTLNEITIASDDVAVGSFEGDVTVTAQDVPIRGGDLGSATATVTLTADELSALMATVDGFPAESLGLADPSVTMSTEISLFGVGFPVGVALTPSAVDGDLVLTPESLQLAGAEVTADGLRDQFGRFADAVLRDWTVCVAQYIPAGVTLTAVEVSGDQLVTDFDIDGAIVSDPALQANGTCDAA